MLPKIIITIIIEESIRHTGLSWLVMRSADELAEVFVLLIRRAIVVS